MGEPKIDHQVGSEFDVLHKTDFVLISADEKMKTLTKTFCDSFQIKCIYFNEATDFHKYYKISLKPAIVVCQFDRTLTDSDIQSQYKNIKTVLRKVPLCLITPNQIQFQLASADFSFQSEKMANDAIQYLLLLKLKGENYEIKFDDLFPSSVVSFNAYQLTPASRKFLPVVFHKLPLSEKKYSRLEKIKNLFIRAGEVALYREYVESFFDDSDFGCKKRAKAHLFEYVGRFYHMKYLFLIGSPSSVIMEQMGELHSTMTKLRKYLDRVSHPFHFIFAHMKNEFLSWDPSWFIAFSCSYIGLNLNWNHETLYPKIGMTWFPQGIEVSMQDRIADLEPSEFEREIWTAIRSQEPLAQMKEEKYSFVFLHHFIESFSKTIDFKKEIPAEDFMTTSKSFWRAQSEANDSEPAQKLLNAMRDLFCTR
jgi:hypothetical protein